MGSTSTSSGWAAALEYLNPVPADVLGFLSAAGLRILRDGTEALACCPMHEARTGRTDRHPSFYVNTVTGAAYCFSCDYRPVFAQLAADVMGCDRSYAVEQILAAEPTERVAAPQHDAPEVTEGMLRFFDAPPQQALDKRRLTEQAAEVFGLRYHPDRGWIIPIRTAEGRLLGWQEKRGKRCMNRPEFVPKGDTLFGYHLLAPDDEVWLVESPLDAAFLWLLGIAAVASFGAGVSTQQIRMLYGRNVILALDDDRAGASNGDRVMEALDGKAEALFFRYTGHGKDPGELTEAQIRRGRELADVYR